MPQPKRSRGMETGCSSNHTVITEYEVAEPRVWTKQHLGAADIRGPPLLTPPQVHDVDDINARGPCGMMPIMVAAVRGRGIDTGEEDEDVSPFKQFIYFFNHGALIPQKSYNFV